MEKKNMEEVWAEFKTYLDSLIEQPRMMEKNGRLQSNSE